MLPGRRDDRLMPFGEAEGSSIWEVVMAVPAAIVGLGSMALVGYLAWGWGVKGLIIAYLIAMPLIGLLLGATAVASAFVAGLVAALVWAIRRALRRLL